MRKLKNLFRKIGIRWVYRNYFSLHKKSIKLAEKTLSNKKIIWNEKDNFLVLSICLLAITLTKLRSIDVLCKSALGKDAVIILRVMFEDITNFNYMDNDKKRVQDFMDFDSYQRMKIGKIISPTQTVKIDFTKLAKRQEELEEIWNKVKYKYTHTYTDEYGNSKQRIFKTWSGKNLKEMAEECGGEETYNYLYGYLSFYVHLTSTTFNDYILGLEKNYVVIEIGESEQYIPEVLATANILTIEGLIRVINKEYLLGLDKEIEALSLEIKSLCKEKG